MHEEEPQRGPKRQVHAAIVFELDLERFGIP
jgi:hypothetical protein